MKSESYPDIPQEPQLHPGSAGLKSELSVDPEPMKKGDKDVTKRKLKGFREFSKSDHSTS